MERLRELRGANSDFDCVIVGNSPSLNKMDLNLLEGKYCFFFNVAFNRNLLRSLPCKVKLINISSNAVFAQPNGLLSRILFKGDAYIREKKLIEKYSSHHANTSILRPTVVIDEGGWKSFFSSCSLANQVIAPAGGEGCRIKITRREHVAIKIENCILGIRIYRQNFLNRSKL